MTSTLFILLFFILNLSFVNAGWSANNFCKCICFGTNYALLPLTLPDNPSQPCLSCTKQWCLNQNIKECAGAIIGDTNPDTATGKEGDVEARCFQRDSPRDQLIVTIFLLTVFGLLLAAGIKNRILKAGIIELPWSRGRETRWWEPWIPARNEPDGPPGVTRFGMTAVPQNRPRDYAPVRH